MYQVVALTRRIIVYKFSAQSRQKKIDLFHQQFESCPEKRILWVGAAFSPNSLAVESLFPSTYAYSDSIIFADIDLQGLIRAKKLFPHNKVVCCDGKRLPFSDKAVDIVFSNAVIEHVGPWPDQQQFAREIMRVGKGWFVATPNFYFPFEFHYWLPFIHWFPKKVQVLIKRFVGGRYPRGAMADVHLLTPREMGRLFPGSKVVLVRATILPESIVAYCKDES